MYYVMKKITFLLFTLFSLSLIGQVKLTSALHEYIEDGAWKNVHNQIFLYDSNNNLFSEEFQRWDETNFKWESFELFKYTYNDNNKLTEKTFEFWDADTVDYISNGKTVYTYNSNNKLIEYIEYYWLNNKWENISKSSFEHNTDGNKTKEFTYSWNGTDWVFEEKLTISYGANGKISNANYEDWNGSIWVSSSVVNYTYNEDDMLILELSQNWNSTAFVNYYKNVYEYDTNGNQTKETVYNSENGLFVFSYDQINTYDTSLLMSSFTHPFTDSTGLEYLFTEVPFINKLLTTSYDTNKITYNYEGTTAGVKNFNAANFEIYPNPTTSIMKIDDSSFKLKSVEVYNLLGKKVLTSAKNELNLQGLVNGLYLVKVQDENGNFTTKKVVKK